MHGANKLGIGIIAVLSKFKYSAFFSILMMFRDLAKRNSPQYFVKLRWDIMYIGKWVISYHTWNWRPNSEGKKPNPAVNDIPPNWAFNWPLMFVMPAPAVCCYWGKEHLFRDVNCIKKRRLDLASHLWFRSMSNWTIRYAFVRCRYFGPRIMLRTSDEQRYYIVPTHSWNTEEAISWELFWLISLYGHTMWRQEPIPRHRPVFSYRLCKLDNMVSAEYSTIDTNMASSIGDRTVSQQDLCLLFRDICYI